jgi:hydroxymethylpyrimidine pyrophosphatase-like HAD family hydrolase
MLTPNERLIPGPKFDELVNIEDLKSFHSDVDNTLVGNESRDLPTERFIAAANAAAKVGKLTVALATARQLKKVEHILRATNAKGISVLSNGGQLFDGKTGEMVVERPINNAAAMAIAKNLQVMGVSHWIQDDGVDHTWSGNVAGHGANLGKYNKENDIWVPGSDVMSVEAYNPRKPFAIIASDVAKENVEQVLDMVVATDDKNVTAFPGHENVLSDGSITYQIFILDKRGTKRYALLQAAELQGTELSEMAAIGDGLNDAVLLETAGVGVAVDNAVAETKQVATFIAPSRENDGAAIALEYFNNHL